MTIRNAVCNVWRDSLEDQKKRMISDGQKALTEVELASLEVPKGCLTPNFCGSLGVLGRASLGQRYPDSL